MSQLSVSQDASNRARVSQSTTLHDGKILNSDNGLTYQNVGTGTGEFTNNKYNMSVTAGQYLVRQSKIYSNYLAGKSQQVELTFDKFGVQEGVTKRVGYFSSNAVAPYDDIYDGFWLENTGTTILLKCARAGTETLSLDITQWDGYDENELDEYRDLSTWDNFTVVAFDFLWLGGAVLRMFVKTSRGFRLAHIFNYSGTSQDVFLKSPNQPIRYEIRSSAGVGELRYVCSQVSTEGSVNESGYNNAGNSLLTAGVPIQRAATVGTSYAVCGVRKKTTHRENGVKIVSVDLAVKTINDYLKYEIILNPTLSAALTYTALTNSSCEFGISGDNTTLSITSTGGRVLHAGYIMQGQVLPSGMMNDNFLAWLGCGIDNTMDQIVLVVTPITANIDLNGCINWKEY